MSSEKNKTKNHHSNGDFRFFKNASLQGFISLRFSEKAITNLSELDSLLEKAKLDKDSKSTTAGVIKLDGKQYFLKRYNNKNFQKKLKNSVRETRPFKALKTSRALNEIDVFTPEIYAALNYRRGLLLESSYLVSSFVESTKTADKIIEDLVEEQGFSIFVDKACQILTKIHDAGIMHGDIKISNILVMPKTDDSYEIGLIDLDGSSCFPKALSKGKRIYDLARLISSYFRSCRDRRLATQDLVHLSQKFIDKYQELTAIDLAGNSLSKRVQYLSTRVRKK